MNGAMNDLLILYPDVYNIPVAMSFPFAVIRDIAYVLFIVFFVLSILEMNVKSIHSHEEANYSRVIINAILVFVGLAWYRHIFMKIVALNEVIGMAVMNNQRIGDLINLIYSNSYDAGAVAGGTTGKILGGLNAILSNLNPRTWGISFLSLAVSIAEPVLLTIRYTLLCVLYIFGPLAFVSSAFRVTKVILRGWIFSVIQVSFWIVTMRIVEIVMLSFNIDSLVSAGYFQDILPWILICTIFLGMYILVPLLTAKLLSGEHLGEIGSIAVAAATVMTAKYGAMAAKAGGHIMGHTNQSLSAVQAGYKSLISRFTKPAKGNDETKKDDAEPKR